MKFSIITVVYNDAKHLEQTIESVINQPEIDVEYIVIDGGSDDGSVEIIKKYEKYLSYWISERDNGIYDAMNKGLTHATGDVVAFLNSGDWYENYALKIVAEYFRDNTVQIIYGKVRQIRNEIDDGFIGITGICNQELIHLWNLYCHQGLFIRKEIFNSIGDFNCNYKIYADYDWNLRAHNSGYLFKTIPQIVSNFRWGGLSTTCSLPGERYKIKIENIAGHEEYREKIEEQFVLDKKEKAISILINDKNENMTELLVKDGIYYIWGMGNYGKICYELLIEKKYNVKAFIDSNDEMLNKSKVNAYTASEFMNKIICDEADNMESMIIITPRRYELEIKNKILKRNPKLAKRIILYSSIQAWALEKYSRKIEHIKYQ